MRNPSDQGSIPTALRLAVACPEQKSPVHRGSPLDPQRNGMLEQIHGSLEARVNLLVYSSSEELTGVNTEFIEFCHFRQNPKVIKPLESLIDVVLRCAQVAGGKCRDLENFFEPNVRVLARILLPLFLISV